MSSNHFALICALLTVFTTNASAERQMSKVGVINTNIEKYSSALCNNGKAATYNYILSTDAGGVAPDGQDYRKKWLVVLSGGGKCTDEASCRARWEDKPSDKVDLSGIGDHYNMVPDDKARNFEGHGILDFDGEKAQYTRRIIGETDNPYRGSNGKDGFNRVWINYCSSDSWQGLGTFAPLATPFPRMAFDNKNAAISRLHFGGAKIVDAVIDLIMHGQIETGGLGDKANTDFIPDAEEGELVLAGSSAGGNGTIRNLDQVTHDVKSINPAVKVYGVIDAINAVGTRPEVQIGNFRIYENGNGFYENAKFYTNGDPTLVRTDFDEATGAACDNSKTTPNGVAINNCYATTSFVLKDEITTPYFVVQQAYDGVVHGSLKTAYTRIFSEFADIASQLPGVDLSSTPMNDPALAAENYIRSRITSESVTIGVKQNNRAGLFIPNYDKAHHQIMTDSQRFYTSDRHRWNAVGNPNLGVEYANTTLSLPTVLGNFRSCVLSHSNDKQAYNNCINTLWSDTPANAIYSDSRVLNTTAITRP
jgi:hypothetical protein